MTIPLLCESQKIEILFEFKWKATTPNERTKKMEHASYTVRNGVDVGYHGSPLHPANGEGRVGKRGIDKTFTLQKVMSLAYYMDEKPNIIIKAGPNAKWYIKKCHPDALEREIVKQTWRNVSRCTMYIINWTPRATKEAAKEAKKPAKEAKKPMTKEAKTPAKNGLEIIKKMY